MLIGASYSEEENLSKKPSWAVGRSLEGDSEEELFELEKKPSWVVGHERERSVRKRIIEFKKDLEQELSLLNKYEDELNVLLPLIHQKLRDKRPSNGAGTRSVSKY